MGSDMTLSRWKFRHFSSTTLCGSHGYLWVPMNVPGEPRRQVVSVFMGYRGFQWVFLGNFITESSGVSWDTVGFSRVFVGFYEDLWNLPVALWALWILICALPCWTVWWVSSKCRAFAHKFPTTSCAKALFSDRAGSPMNMLYVRKAACLYETGWNVLRSQGSWCKTCQLQLSQLAFIWRFDLALGSHPTKWCKLFRVANLRTFWNLPASNTLLSSIRSRMYI